RGVHHVVVVEAREVGELDEYGVILHSVRIDVAEGRGQQHEHGSHALAAGVHEMPSCPTHHVIRCGHGGAQTVLDGSETLDDAGREVLIDVGNARQRGRHGSPGTGRGTGVPPWWGLRTAWGGDPLPDPTVRENGGRSDSGVYRGERARIPVHGPGVSGVTRRCGLGMQAVSPFWA